MITYSMADKSSDTYLLLFGLAILMGMGFLFWKVLAVDKTATTTTIFSRDEQGRISEIVERKF